MTKSHLIVRQRYKKLSRSLKSHSVSLNFQVETYQVKETSGSSTKNDGKIDNFIRVGGDFWGNFFSKFCEKLKHQNMFAVTATNGCGSCIRSWRNGFECAFCFAKRHFGTEMKFWWIDSHRKYWILFKSIGVSRMDIPGLKTSIEEVTSLMNTMDYNASKFVRPNFQKKNLFSRHVSRTPDSYSLELEQTGFCWCKCSLTVVIKKICD